MNYRFATQFRQSLSVVDVVAEYSKTHHHPDHHDGDHHHSPQAWSLSLMQIWKRNQDDYEDDDDDDHTGDEVSLVWDELGLICQVSGSYPQDRWLWTSSKETA